MTTDEKIKQYEKEYRKSFPRKEPNKFDFLRDEAWLSVRMERWFKRKKFKKMFGRINKKDGE